MTKKLMTWDDIVGMVHPEWNASEKTRNAMTALANCRNSFHLLCSPEMVSIANDAKAFNN